jgi:uracil-DNA glycosylase family 4
MPIVPGFGNRQAKILVLGEAPASNEVREGRPFVGRAGQELANLFASIGLDLDKDIYRTNASLEPVQGDKDDFFFEPNGAPSQVLLRGMAALVEDLREIQPRVVVPMGNYALWVMRQHMDIMRWRGSIIPSKVFGVKCVPTLHPAALLWDQEGSGMWKYRPVIIWDLERAKEQAEFPELRLRQRKFLIDPQGTERVAAIERLRNAKRLTFDNEGPHGKIGVKCVGFSDFDPEWAVCFWNHGTETMELFRSLLETDVPKYGQNLMYDVGVFDQMGVHVRNVQHDTMLAQHAILPDLPKGLDFLASIYTDVPYYKDEGKTANERQDPHQLMGYNCKDVVCTTEVAIHQEEHFEADPNIKATFRRSMAMFDPLREPLYEGHRVDLPLLENYIDETEIRRARLQAALDQVVGHPVNVNSPDQVKKLIYEERGLPPRTRNKKLTTEADVLMDLAAKTGDPILISILEVRKARKLLSSYYRKDILSPDGRLRWEYKIAGTKTGRLSCQAPTWGPGLNGQTLPPHARRMIIPDEGWEFCEADGMQAEAILTAVYAQDPIFLDCFRTGKDVHRYMAAMLSGLDPERWAEIPKHSKLRQLGKTCNHAFDYEMYATTFMYTVNEDWDPTDPESLRMDYTMAQALRAKYMALRPALASYWEWIRAQLRESRTLVNPFGRTRLFLDRLTDATFRDAYSWLPQGTVGDATNVGILQVREAAMEQGLTLKLKAQTHDSALWTYPVEQRDWAVQCILDNSEVPFHINGMLFTVPYEAVVGDSWYKLKPNDPPEWKGLKDAGKSRKTIELGADEYERMLTRMHDALR